MRAIRSESTLTRALCLPSAMCGPFCSVPPIGRIIVVFPVWTNVCSSGHVSSSRKTVSGGSPKVGVTMTLRLQRAVTQTFMSLLVIYSATTRNLLLSRGQLGAGQPEHLRCRVGPSRVRLLQCFNVDFLDRKSTRLNSSHGSISYAVFCLKK